MSDPQIILQALKKTVTGSSTEEIKEAEILLNKYESKQDFVSSIALILQQSTVDSNLQKAAAVYLNKHVNNVVKTRNQQLINNTAQNVLKLLPNFKIKSQLKIHICRSLEYLLSSDKSKIIRSAFEPNLIGILNQAQQQPDDQVNFQFLVFFGQILMNNPGFTEEVSKFISKTYFIYVKLTIRVINLLEQVLQAKNADLAAKLLFLTRQYLYLLKLYLKRFLFVDVEANKLLFIPEIVTVITKSLQIQLPNNQLTYPIYHLVPNPSPQQRILNQIKANCISFLNNLIRTLLSIVKQPSKILDLNPTFIKTTQILPLLIKSSQELMKSTPYYKIKDLSILATLDEVYGFFITTIRANNFYNVFVEHKEKMIEDLIFRALMLTPQDYENYYQEPEQFINTLVHIIERDIKVKIGRSKQDGQENEIESFATLRTNAAQFLNTFCKYQDGTLTEIMQYAFLILENKVNSQFTPSLMLIVITILRDISKERKDLHLLISNLAVKLLNEMQMPKKSTQQPQSKNTRELDIQYSLVLLLLSKYYSRIQMVNPKIIDISFKLCHKLLNDQKVQEVPKLIALDIIEVINHLQVGQPYSPQILKTFNNIIMHQQKPSQKLLQAYFSLIKYNDVILKNTCFKELCQTIQIMAHFIHKEIQSSNREQIIINKLWNVIRQVGENAEFIPLMIEPIEKAIMPLLPYIEGNYQLDFEEDILMLMSSFIGKSRQVTQNQLKMFEIIPKIFYNQYKAMFGHSYETMQTFIYYGKQILKTSPAAINSIIHMCLTSISSSEYKGKKLSQGDNCQGALLLQSLIIAVGYSIDIKLYEQMSNVITKRLSENLRFDFFKANLVALLTLILIPSCASFEPQVSQHILSLILNSLGCFKKVKHAPKILIISLNKLLLKFEFEFIRNRFTQILDSIITLLQLSAMKKNNCFDQQDDDEERDYQNALIQTINQIMNMDEFQDFKNQIKTLKQQNLALIQSTYNQLPQSKKDFMKHVLAVERVSNEPRKIFTIKRNK